LNNDLDLRVWVGTPLGGESFLWYVWFGNCFEDDPDPQGDHLYHSQRSILPTDDLECAGNQPGGPFGDAHNNVEVVRIRPSDLDGQFFYV